MTRALRFTALMVCAVAIAALTAGSALAKHGPLVIDHYKVYNNADISFTSDPFDLTDQFGDQLNVQTEVCDFHATPVSKNGEGITKPLLHQAWYRIDGNAPTGMPFVVVDNQFGNYQKWRIGRAKYIVTPASKATCFGGPTPGAPCTGSGGQGSCGIGGVCALTAVSQLCVGGAEPPNTTCGPTKPCSMGGTCTPPAPGGLALEDHYKCYEVLEGSVPLVPPVNLVDQFATQVTPVGVPRYFCNPVEKAHNGNTFVPPNPLDHLACYDIDHVPQSNQFDSDQQFGVSFGLQLERAELLCVPSHKDFPVPALGPWGIATLGGLLILTAMFTISYSRRHRAQVHSS